MSEIGKLLHYLDSSTLHEIAWDLDLAQTEEDNTTADSETIGRLLEQVNTQCAEINAARCKLTADIADSANIPELLEVLGKAIDPVGMVEWRRTVAPPGESGA